MPTPVTTARQCLTPEAVKALDDAVAVARRRGHAQTTSVHMVSSLLSLPSSALREACSRTRNNAYSARIQFKALELCLGVSLDRLPSSPNGGGGDEPPVSNSLMAAIKRSQANQRRQPENFNFYHQQQHPSFSCSSPPVVKVELQNMIISILDDPVVSRVFGEAGFSSCDIKIAILRPVHQFFRHSRYKGPPLFLCNFTFPFPGYQMATKELSPVESSSPFTFSSSSTLSTSSSHKLNLEFDLKDFKILHKALAERVGWQDEAAKAVSQRITMERHNRTGRGDIWFHFTGPDSLGKKKLAIALSETLYGSTHSLICVDLSFQERPKSLFDLLVLKNKYDVRLRGKTAVDYIAEKLAEKPMSVIYLENLEKADLILQNSLSRAVKTGKFQDSRGREVSIRNAILVTASGCTVCEEENMLSARGWPIHIQIGVDLGDDQPKKRKSFQMFDSQEKVKRAYLGSNHCLDLNLPAEDNERSQWLDDFLRETVNETLMFKPLSFDSLAEEMVKVIERCFYQTVSSECLLEIECKVMEQIVAASCLTNNKKVEDWIQSVLRRGFAEAQEKYSLTAHSVVKLVTSPYLEECIPGEILTGKVIMK